MMEGSEPKIVVTPHREADQKYADTITAYLNSSGDSRKQFLDAAAKVAAELTVGIMAQVTTPEEIADALEEIAYALALAVESGYIAPRQFMSRAEVEKKYGIKLDDSPEPDAVVEGPR